MGASKKTLKKLFDILFEIKVEILNHFYQFICYCAHFTHTFIMRNRMYLFDNYVKQLVEFFFISENE